MRICYKNPKIINNIYDLPGEIWKDIPEYEGFYAVSNIGRIKSIARYTSSGNWIKTRIMKLLKRQNYVSECYIITLSRDGKAKSFKTNRTVYEAFIGKIDENHVVIHLDGNNFNDALDNLKVISRCDLSNKVRNGPKGQNIIDTLIDNNNNNKKPVVQLDLDDNVIAWFDCASDVTRKFGFNHSNISASCNGRRKTAYGFKWKFKDGN